jgi:predicted RNA-binding Zn ribbon-like protein
MVISPFTETTPIGQLAIDFANTIRQPRADDAISSPRALHEWLIEAGVLTEDEVGSEDTRFPSSPPDRRLLTEEALRLRAEVRYLLSAVSRREAPIASTLVALDRVLARGRWSHRLGLDADKPRLLKTYIDDGPETLLVPVALAAAEIAAYAHPDRLRTCVAAECTKWFLDTSKGGRRRWCSMATCGNRSKAARFRERQVG